MKNARLNLGFNSRIGQLSLLLIFIVVFALNAEAKSTKKSGNINFVYTSDAHYGIKRATFRGATNVDAHLVNLAMIEQINTVPGLTLPNDGGVKANQLVGGVDYLFETGDATNRMEAGIQSATASWGQFIADYTTGVKLTDESGNKTKLYLIPGNHDVSNAIGYYKPMTPAVDAGAMVGMYNLVHPESPKTVETYNYNTDKVHYSFDKAGIHFTFVCMWPDSAERVWIDKDIANVTGPVILFTHDQPDIETKHLMNPNTPSTINPTDKFENMVAEKCKDGKKTSVSSTIEQRNLAAWLKAHPIIKAYFHGNDNANEFYTFTGPYNNISLPVFRVDSPMKGNVSAADETKLSFQLATIDVASKTLTVRELLWNTTTATTSPIVFGTSKTISLK